MSKLTNRGRPKKVNEDESIPEYKGESRLKESWTPPEKCLWFDLGVFSDCWKIRERVSTVEWFEKNLIVDGRTSDFQGSYSRMNFPYQVGPLDAFDNMEVKQMSFQWATQTGKSFIIQNLPVKIADTDPSPMMYAVPDESTAKEVSDKRIMPAFEKIPRLAAKLLPEARRNSLQPDFGDCLMFMGWSGSPSTLGQRSCRYVFCTELAKWDTSKSTEADPADLVGERVKSFWDSKIIFEGTPTVEGTCRVEQLGRLANQRLKYKVPCPHCGTRQILWFAQIKWEKLHEKNDADLAEQTAYFECAKCKQHIHDGDKMDMLKWGVWAEEDTEIPDGFTGSIYYTPGKQKTRLHFDLSSIYSPIVTFGQMASKFIIANQGQGIRRLQNFINSWLGEVWNPVVREYDWKALNILRADTPMGTVPEWVMFITAGIDIGRNSAHYVVRGWGHGGRSRLIDCGIAAYTKVDTVCFDKLEEFILARTFAGKPVLLTGIDSGYQTYNVYAWCNYINTKYGERVRPIKGSPKGAPYYCSKQERSAVDGAVLHNGVNLWIINDPLWKEFLTGKYTLPAGEPESFEIPSDVNEGYVKSLTAESLVEKHDARGNITYQWKVLDKTIGNHFFDAEKICAVMADMCDWRSLPAVATVTAPVMQKKEIDTNTNEGFYVDSNGYWG